MDQLLKNKKILITGATGFVGGRLVEKLIKENQADIRVLLSRYTNASRIGRFPIEMFKADILNRQRVFEAAAGCDYIIHCAYGSRGEDEYRRRTNVEGTKNIAEAAINQNVKKLIHLSTVMVYENQEKGIINEKTPETTSKNTYAAEKLEAEKIILNYHKEKGLPAVIIQPTKVIGPFAPSWTINVINRLKKNKQILVDDGEGLCNYIFIEDLADAIIKSLNIQNIEGERFLISAKNPATWKDFFGYYESMLNQDCLVPMSSFKARIYTKKLYIKNTLPVRMTRSIFRHPRIKGKLKSLGTKAKLEERSLPDRIRNPLIQYLYENKDDNHPIEPLTAEKIKNFKSKVIVDISKSEEKLGFTPQFNLHQSMSVIEKWAKWSNIVN
jgi:nucleoside-diphosphate-sugar epimerase